MSSFSLNTKVLKNEKENLGSIRKTLQTSRGRVDNIANHLSLSGSGFSQIQKSLKITVESLDSINRSATQMENSFGTVITTYENTEKSISGYTISNTNAPSKGSTGGNSLTVQGSVPSTPAPAPATDNDNERKMGGGGRRFDAEPEVKRGGAGRRFDAEPEVKRGGAGRRFDAEDDGKEGPGRKPGHHGKSGKPTNSGGGSHAVEFPYTYSQYDISVPIRAEYLSKEKCLEMANKIINENGENGMCNNMDAERIAKELYFHAIAYYGSAGPLMDILEQPLPDGLKDFIISHHANPANIGLGDGNDGWYDFFW